MQETSTDALRVHCAFCPKSFSRKRQLKRHIARQHKDAVKTYANGDRYNCNKCEKGFLSGQKLKKHMRLHIVTESGEHECEVCQKRFSSNCSLVLHRNIHLEEKPYICNDCDKGFSQKGNLKAHRKSYHEKELNDVLSEGFNDVLVGEAETIEVEVDFSGGPE